MRRLLDADDAFEAARAAGPQWAPDHSDGGDRRHDGAAPRAADGHGEVAGQRFRCDRQGWAVQALGSNDGQARAGRPPEDVSLNGVAIGKDGHRVFGCRGRGGQQVVGDDDARVDAAPAMHLHDGWGGCGDGCRDLGGE